MPEQLDLAVPIVPSSITSYQILRITFDLFHSTIRIELGKNDGNAIVIGYDGAEANQLMKTLNTSNLTAISLHKRIFNKLIADGKLPTGNISGTP